MALHRFGVGQRVALIPNAFFKAKTGPYEVLRLLLNDGIDREYHIRHLGDGHERVVRQSEILGKAAPG